MSIPVPVEGERQIKKEPGQVVQFTSSHQDGLIKTVTNHVQATGYKSFTEDQATPATPQPLPATPALRQVQAIRLGTEPKIGEDLSSANIARLVIEELRGDTGSGYRVVSGTGKAGILTNMKRWAQQRLARKAI